jgi:hypothetical protein
MLEAMNVDLYADGEPSLTKPYCGQQGSAVTEPAIPNHPWDSDGKEV